MLSLVLALALAAPADAAPREVAFWREAAKNGFPLPEGAAPGALLLEASAFLGSPDPTLRDGVAYAAAAEWIARKKAVEPAELRKLLAVWTPNLREGVGEKGSDRVLLRSFSALDLSLLAARDLETPYLEPAELTALLEAALAYLEAERDLRAYDEGKGWIHATAHTADLLKFLARNQRLPRADAARILLGIGAKARDAGEVFAWGEDERLASAVLAVIRRKDLDPAWLESWLSGLTASAKGLWDAPALDVRQFAAVQNGKHVLARLHVLLSVVPDPPPAVGEARGRVLHALEQLPLIVHLLDGTYELFRHFYGLRRVTKGNDAPFGAVGGVLGTTLQMIESGATHLGVATDHVIESFRNRLWRGYKTGVGIEPALLAQFHPLEEALAAMGIAVWPMVELEADDALASAARIAAEDPRVQQVCLWTPDKDLAQCVRDTRVVQVDSRRKKILNAEGVREKYGVPPALIPDFLALVGDAADGYPGIPGIGPVTAARLLSQHGPIEQLPAAALGEQRDMALLFKDLATLRTDAPLFDDVEALQWRGPTPSFAAMAERMGEARLVERARRAPPD